MHSMGDNFAAPKKKDAAGWLRIAKIIRSRGYTAKERKLLAREGMFTPEDNARRRRRRPWWQRIAEQCARGL